MQTPPLPQALQESRVPIRRVARHLRWFKSSFEQQVELIARDHDAKHRIRPDKLARAFVDWSRVFTEQKPRDRDLYQEFVGFSSGVMLYELIKCQPLEMTLAAAPDNEEDPVAFWPEGYAYVAYCLNVRATVLRQDFGSDISSPPEIADIRTWWSFKENVQEDPSLAVAFLDYFSGAEPNWKHPLLFEKRPKVEKQIELQTSPQRGIA